VGILKKTIKENDSRGNLKIIRKRKISYIKKNEDPDYRVSFEKSEMR